MWERKKERKKEKRGEVMGIGIRKKWQVMVGKNEQGSVLYIYGEIWLILNDLRLKASAEIKIFKRKKKVRTKILNIRG